MGTRQKTTSFLIILMDKAIAVKEIVAILRNFKEKSYISINVGFAVQKALDETQTLFDSLMQEYFG